MAICYPRKSRRKSTAASPRYSLTKLQSAQVTEHQPEEENRNSITSSRLALVESDYRLPPPQYPTNEAQEPRLPTRPQSYPRNRGSLEHRSLNQHTNYQQVAPAPDPTPPINRQPPKQPNGQSSTKQSGEN
ncbi:S-adenosyl-L-methionine-dependentmethyltransferases superfamily protein [Striga asiatica]|uniref:S-adenosyl-L-methionine-dependentmethyltransferases superfamily protein n=1 Tax=Striga asiatica TaxID=4170 RepID=A0A5A7Q7A5_STRAF|nr:S-adenosyl-L-methionine-dependentmethyltransferases superfamily protein [Striga asiatica]